MLAISISCMLLSAEQAFSAIYDGNTTITSNITENSTINSGVEVTFTGTRTVNSGITFNNFGTINIGTSGTSSTLKNSGTISGGIINVINKQLTNDTTGSIIANEINLSNSRVLANKGSVSVGKIILGAGTQVK